MKWESGSSIPQTLLDNLLRSQAEGGFGYELDELRSREAALIARYVDRRLSECPEEEKIEILLCPRTLQTEPDDASVSCEEITSLRKFTVTIQNGDIHDVNLEALLHYNERREGLWRQGEYPPTYERSGEKYALLAREFHKGVRAANRAMAYSLGGDIETVGGVHWIAGVRDYQGTKVELQLYVDGRESDWYIELDDRWSNPRLAHVYRWDGQKGREFYCHGFKTIDAAKEFILKEVCEPGAAQEEAPGPAPA